MKVKITLKRSFIGKCKKHRRILESLGLRRLNQSVMHNDIPSVTGMVDKVSYMVEMVRLKEQEARKLKNEEIRKK